MDATETLQGGGLFQPCAMERGTKQKGIFKRLKFWRKSDMESKDRDNGEEREHQHIMKKGKKLLKDVQVSDKEGTMKPKEKRFSIRRFTFFRTKHKHETNHRNNSCIQQQFQAASNADESQTASQVNLYEGPPTSTFPARETFAQLRDSTGKERVQVFHADRKACNSLKPRNGAKLKGWRTILNIVPIRSLIARKDKRNVKYKLVLPEGKGRLEVSDMKCALSAASSVQEASQFTDAPSCSEVYTMPATSRDSETTTGHEEKNKYVSCTEDSSPTIESEHLVVNLQSNEATRQEHHNEPKTCSQFFENPDAGSNGEIELDSTDHESAECLAPHNRSSLPEKYVNATFDHRDESNHADVVLTETSTSYERTMTPCDTSPGLGDSEATTSFPVINQLDLMTIKENKLRRYDHILTIQIIFLIMIWIIAFFVV